MALVSVWQSVAQAWVQRNQAVEGPEVALL